MNDRQRYSLWQEANERNSRLQQPIETIAQLVARSRDVLRRQRPEDGAPAGHAKSDSASERRAEKFISR